MRIVRHQIVKGASSPDDPALTDYWTERRAKTPPPTIGRAGWRLYEAQHERCPLCGDWLLPAEDTPQTPREWEQWQATTRKTIIHIATRGDGTPDEPEHRLAHAYCHRRHTTSGDRSNPALLPARDPEGLA
jgi:RNA-directed DNA polymerase